MAFFRDPGEMFLGCLGTVEQRYLVNLIKNAAKNGYTRFVEPCAGTFAMSNLAIQNGYKPEQIETSDVSMMSSVMGYAITGKPLDELEIHAQGFSDEELLDPAVALYAQMYLRTSKTAGNEYFFNLLKDLRDRREEHIEHIRQSLENIKKEMYGMTYRPLDMWDHLDEVLDDPHTLVIANPPTYFSGYEKFYDTQGKMTWKEPEYKLFDPETGHVELFDRCMNANALVVCYQEKRTGEAGLKEIIVILDKSGLTRSKAASKQLAHNAISGFDDESTLREIVKLMDNVDDMMESYIGKEILEEPLEQFDKLNTPAVQFDFKTIAFAFLPNQIRDLDALMKNLNGSCAEIIGVAAYEQCEKFVETLDKYQQFTDIRNVGAAVHSMIDAANEKMDDAGFDPDMDWTYLAKVFGSAAIPVESAEVIKKALKKAEKDGTITSKNKWQMIEYWAADYLAGK